MKINLIACVSKNNVIGNYRNELIYHIKEDMKRFKEITMGHPVVMGRKTLESIPGNYLPGRRNCVLTHALINSTKPIDTYRDIESLLESFNEDEEVFVIGGEQIYEEFLPMADCLYLTEVDDIPDEFERYLYKYFPEYNNKFKCVEREHHKDNNYSYDFTKYIKK